MGMIHTQSNSLRSAFLFRHGFGLSAEILFVVRRVFLTNVCATQDLFFNTFRNDEKPPPSLAQRQAARLPPWESNKDFAL